MTAKFQLDGRGDNAPSGSVPIRSSNGIDKLVDKYFGWSRDSE